MVFLVDFVARGLGRGLETGAFYWLIFGLGAMAGALLAGNAADRIGFRAMLRLAFVIQAAAIAVLAVAPRALRSRRSQPNPRGIRARRRPAGPRPRA